MMAFYFAYQTDQKCTVTTQAQICLFEEDNDDQKFEDPTVKPICFTVSCPIDFSQL